jgi:hypothetical protein
LVENNHFKGQKLAGKTAGAPSKAVVSQLDNPAWSKVSHHARTELNVYLGKKIRKA